MNSQEDRWGSLYLSLSLSPLRPRGRSHRKLPTAQMNLSAGSQVGGEQEKDTESQEPAEGDGIDEQVPDFSGSPKVRTCCASLLPLHTQPILIDQVDLPSPTRSPANAGEVQCRHLSEHGQDESIVASKVAATLWLILTFAAGTTSRKLQMNLLRSPANAREMPCGSPLSARAVRLDFLHAR